MQATLKAITSIEIQRTQMKRANQMTKTLTPTATLLKLLPTAEIETYQEPIYLPTDDGDPTGPMKWWWDFSLTAGQPDGYTITLGQASPVWTRGHGPFDTQEQAYQDAENTRHDILNPKA